jgi:aminoglycoside phosphotransferase (APT) family kinase protein
LEVTIDVAAALKIWEQAVAAPLWDKSLVWIHADLHPGNILVHNGAITAVIDFGMAGLGDPAVDMMAAWTVLSPETRNVFRTIVKADEATWQRGKGWALSFGVIALPYYKDRNPVLARIALQTINAVLAEHL